MTDTTNPGVSLFSGRFAHLPLTAAIGLLIMTPLVGNWSLWPPLAAGALAASLAVPCICR